MATEERLKILTEAEIGDLFGPPVLNHNDQRFFFTLNDQELAIAQKIRRRDQRCMFVVLLGYFKVKLITLSPGTIRLSRTPNTYAPKSFPVRACVHLISLRKLAFEFINAFTNTHHVH